MRNYLGLIGIAFAITMSSCIKEGYDDENCRDEYNITVTWPVGTPGDDEKTTITIINPDGTKTTIHPNDPTELEEGKHQISGVSGNDDDKVEVDGSTVTVKPKEDGTAGDPGDFMGGSTDIEITQDSKPNIEVPMIQQSRPLVIKVKLEGYGVDAIDQITGMVSGIALSRHINDGFVPVDGKPRHPALQSGNVSYDSMPKGEDGFYTGNQRLLGIDGDASQQLGLTVELTDGTILNFPFDITTDMDGFHVTDVTQPWVIEIVLHLGADFHATIEDWKVGPEEWMEAQ